MNVTIEKQLETKVGFIPQVASQWKLKDYLGAIAVRSNIGRMRYAIKPGLYAINTPDASSPVFASANYKLSFDYLKRSLKGISAWIIVLDTKGINVWCAAGKGTFGTEELVKQINETKIEQLIDHKKIIVPQLGAPGVAAHEVKKQTGMHVVYGPIRSEDISTFLDSNMKATKAMREVTFDFWERVVLVPVEFSAVLKYFIVVAVIGTALLGVHIKGYTIALLLERLPLFFLALTFTLISGAVLTPILLPFLPGKAFSVKGFVMGLVSCSFLIFIMSITGSFMIWSALGYSFLILAGSSFLAMGFTGASTYTSLSGVLYEMKKAIPLQKIGIGLSLAGWIVSLLVEGVK